MEVLIEIIPGQAPRQPARLSGTTIEPAGRILFPDQRICPGGLRHRAGDVIFDGRLERDPGRLPGLLAKPGAIEVKEVDLSILEIFF